MIFVTVGAQMPFDRLVRAVDAWAAARHRDDVFAQIGPGAWRPVHSESTEFLDPEQYLTRCRQADVIVSHAGMGTIITALQLARPLLVMPRRGDLRETRNDHQIATARRFAEQGRLAVAFDADELAAQLDRLTQLDAPPPIGPHASERLLATISAFITGEPLPHAENPGESAAILSDDDSQNPPHAASTRDSVRSEP